MIGFESEETYAQASRTFAGDGRRSVNQIWEVREEFGWYPGLGIAGPVQDSVG